MNNSEGLRIKLWLGLRFVALPAVLLLPFLLVKYTGARCYSSRVPLVNIFSGKPTGQLTTAGNLQLLGPPTYFGVLFWLVVAAFLIVSFLQVGPKRYRIRQHFAKQQIKVAVASVFLTVLLYRIMYNFSQWTHFPKWWCDSSYHLHGQILPGAHFGLGLAPIAALFFVIIYLVAVLLPYALTMSTKNRVGGHGKGKVFK